MKVRILTSIVLAVFGIPLLVFSDYIVYPIGAALFSAIAVYEMMGVFGMRKRWAVSIPSYLASVFFPVSAYFVEERLSEFATVALFSMFGLLLYFFAYSVIKKGEVKFSDISAHFTTLFYIVLSFTSLTLVRYIPNGAYYFGLVFLGSWVCDIFAYFTGRAIGKHKLIPEVSPKKTVEGAIGGVVFTTIVFIIYGFVITLIDGSPKPNYIVLAVLGFVLSIVSMFGDLIASLIKREHGIKDYGRIFPGHGGVLDRFDSILAVAPVLFAICVFFPPFN